MICHYTFPQNLINILVVLGPLFHVLVFERCGIAFFLVLDKAREWYSTSGLLINQRKTQLMIFGLRLVTNETGMIITLLGCHLDPVLIWNPHLQHILQQDFTSSF